MVTRLFFGKEGVLDDGPLSTIFDIAEGMQVLIQVFSDHQIHLAFRHHPNDSWTPGYWSVLTGGNK